MENRESPCNENDHIEDLSATDITHNHYAHLCKAMTTICTEALKEILLTQVPASYENIYQAIRAKQVNLTSRREGTTGQWQNAILNKNQIKLVFPDPKRRYIGTVDQYDVSLLYTIIKNISSVPAPITGWGNPSKDQPRDKILGASVERIYSYNNIIICQSLPGRISQMEFEKYWCMINEVLHDIENVIGNHGYQQALEKSKTEIITRLEASELINVFQDYKKQEENVTAEAKLRGILSLDKYEMHQRKEEFVDILFQSFNRHAFSTFLSVVESDEVLEYVFSHILKIKHKEALDMTLCSIQDEWRTRLNDSKLVLWLGSNYDICKDGTLTLVCYHMTSVETNISFYLGLPVLYRHFHKIEREPLEIRIHQKYQHMSLSATDARLIEQLIPTYSEELFTKHSNLEAISASSVISSKTKGLVEETSIVLYCRLKGVVPFGETFFPLELKIEDRVFFTDVHEGFFSFGMNAVGIEARTPNAREFLNPLKMGCSIGKFDHDSAGTLGPFVRLADDIKGFLTCAHVFGVTYINDGSQIFAVQPAIGETGQQQRRDVRQCGCLERAVFDTNQEISIDAALIQIDESRRDIDPIGFVWDHSNQLARAEFSETYPPSFQHGIVIEQLDFATAFRKRVIKCGRSTGLTMGSFALMKSVIKIYDAALSLPQGMMMNNQTSHIMRGQYIVESCCNEPFFMGGDSGSGVYIVDSSNKLALVGLAIGSLTPLDCVVTPIGAVLNALGLTSDSIMTDDDMDHNE